MIQAFDLRLVANVLGIALQSTETDTDTGVETINFTADLSIQYAECKISTRVDASIARDHGGCWRTPGKDEGIPVSATLDQIYEWAGPVLFEAVGSDVAAIVYSEAIRIFGK